MRRPEPPKRADSAPVVWRLHITTDGAYLRFCAAAQKRKGFEGLYGLVRDRLACEPLSGHIFLFSNAQRNRLKMIFWDGSGLWVCAN